MSNKHTEFIFCPECGSLQDATVTHTVPWHIMVHNCTSCHYTITESEWNRATDDEVNMYKALYNLFVNTPGMVA